ncbi:MAG: Xaa-Pro dipeptidase [Deltaproteobacteria bacterium]|nr:Xaa-Pro dipeptidase [Deltaproteobacteria bacterium]
MSTLFKQHIRHQIKRLEEILSEHSLDGLVLGAGTPFVYFRDDQEAPFHPNPYFTHWCPERSPHHFLHLRAGQKPKLVFYTPKDYWYEQPSVEGIDWVDEFEVIQTDNLEARWTLLGETKRHVFIGSEEKEAKEKGFVANADKVLAHLDWFRAEKTSYEIDCIEKANENAAIGHKAARKMFKKGANELEVHLAFLEAVQCSEYELPYPSIVGMNEKSATLHYQKKRTGVKKADVMLIDCGARVRGYASDITRTYVRKKTPRIFRNLLGTMDALQKSLCKQVRPGVSYFDLQVKTHRAIAEILLDAGVLKGCDVDLAFEKELTNVFYPHGLGHMLGIQVHDVGGFQKDHTGADDEQSPKFPKLRMRRALRVNEVVTVEPGLYFMPLRLEGLKGDDDLRKYVKWSLIDELVPLGGIRIEDNVVVTNSGYRNLTRPYLKSDYLV